MIPLTSRCLLPLVALPLVLRAQSVHEVRASAEVLKEEFTSIAAVRELSDGRVLVSDRRDKRVVVGTWPDGAARKIGRVGDGPNEYRAPTALLRGNADTTYIVDYDVRRWLVLVGDGFGRSLEPEIALRLTRFEPPIHGMNGEGLILIGLPAVRSGRTFTSDSILLALASARSDRVDTIARLRGRGSERGEVIRNDGGMPTHYALYNPFGVEEQALMFPDGWIALAFHSPYRVDWRAPNGAILKGPTLDSVRYPVTEREKQFAVAREWAWLPKPTVGPSDFRAWPELIPAFPNDALLGLPDGRLAIARMPTVADPHPKYDIVNRRGRMVGRISLQPRHRIVGFGVDHFYVVTKDDLDVERLSRHVMPKM